MLSDEMTTGSVTTTDSDKRAFAARSHAWNLEQRRFKEAFPDVRLLFESRSVAVFGGYHPATIGAHILTVICIYASLPEFSLNTYHTTPVN